MEKQREQAWKYFELHAKQRMSIFNFYITLSTAIIAAVGILSTLKDIPLLFFTGLGILLIIFSAVFWGLDKRTKDLIHLSEDKISEMEEKNKTTIIDIITSERTKSGARKFRLISYTFLFGVIYTIFISSGIFLIFYGLRNNISIQFIEFNNSHVMKVLTIQNIGNTILIGIVASVFAVIVMKLYIKFRSYTRLYGFYGKYYEITQDNQEHREITYNLKYRYRNFWSIDDKLIIENISKNPWKGEISINHDNPFQTVGIYNYPDNRWGYQKLYFNRKDLKIFIISDFSPSGKHIDYRYSIKKY